MNGILIIDKPSGMTSHDVVARIRRILKGCSLQHGCSAYGADLSAVSSPKHRATTNAPTHQRTNAPRVGHAGTLDPLATGVLPILIGKATKLSSLVMEGEKEYIADLKFGEATDTDDAQGVVISRGFCPERLEDRIRDVLPRFLGKTTQIPPKYSAIKKNGRPFYKIARNNEDFVPPPREIVINEIELVSVTGPSAKIRVRCQKGTYIRALARDIGRGVGSFAHITALRRTICGGYSICDAVELNKIFTGQEISRMLREPPLLKESRF